LKHANVALFVPNNGCRHACSFCSQRSITGVQVQPTADDVRSAADTALADLGEKSKEAEIAFFGGSFTAIERTYMLELLQAAEPYIKNGSFAGIRISTRPDAIDAEILTILKEYGVTTVELGAQSMDNRVLALNGRGHTTEQVVSASRQICNAGFALGLQMMTGLMGDSDDGARKTAAKIASLQPECVRIYPTIALRGTELGDAYLRGEYAPQTLESAVELCAGLLDFFDSYHIPVIRLGLHASPELERDMLAGPWHPAFRELCESRRFLKKMMQELQARKTEPGQVTIFVHPGCISQASGQKKSNLRALAAHGYTVKIKPDVSVERGCIKIL
jgi:histone acetyltransferase (RNA polymerase elongator complex component)